MNPPIEAARERDATSGDAGWTRNQELTDELYAQFALGKLRIESSQQDWPGLQSAHVSGAGYLIMKEFST